MNAHWPAPARAAETALFDDTLACDAILPAGFVPGPGTGQPHQAEALLRSLAQVEDLRGEDGAVRGFYLPQQDGFVGVPTAASPLTPGIPCADFAPDFRAGDIACRQAAPGFDFALRHRWSLQGRALSAGSPDLHAVAGHEVDGSWWLQAVR